MHDSTEEDISKVTADLTVGGAVLVGDRAEKAISLETEYLQTREETVSFLSPFSHGIRIRPVM